MECTLAFTPAPFSASDSASMASLQPHLSSSRPGLASIRCRTLAMREMLTSVTASISHCPLLCTHCNAA